MNRIRPITFALVLVLIFALSACGEQKDNGGDTVSGSSVQSSAENKPSVSLAEGSVKSAVGLSDTYGTVVEQLSLTPLTDAPSFLVKGTKNYKWIAYNNYNINQRFESGAKLAKGGYLFYIELPETDFGHEMYLEFFASHEKVEEYSGEVAYTESDKKWYSLSENSAAWSEHITEKYKLCFNDGGKAFRGYVFIPADSLTYRYESDDLSDICVFVKSGIETGNGDVGDGIDFKMSAVMLVDEFDPAGTVAESALGRFDLSESLIPQ